MTEVKPPGQSGMPCSMPSLGPSPAAASTTSPSGITAMAPNVEEQTITQLVLARSSPPPGRPWNPSPSTAPGTKSASLRP